MIELGFVIGLLALICVAAWSVYGAGRDSERGKAAEDSLDAIDKAKKAERDARAVDDPRGELLKRWKR